jgi:hypothetical protein
MHEPFLPTVLRNMSNGYKHQHHESQDAEPATAPKRRRTPTVAGLSPAVDGSAPARRATDAGDGGGDERSVVELETDADGMDDGYRCEIGMHLCSSAAARLCSAHLHLILTAVIVCFAGGASTDKRLSRATLTHAATTSARIPAATCASRWSAAAATRACWSPPTRARTPTTRHRPRAARAQEGGVAACMPGVPIVSRCCSHG